MKLCTGCSLVLALWLLPSTKATSQNASDTILGTSGLHIGSEIRTFDSHLGAALTITVLKDERNHLDRQAVIAVKRPGDAKGVWQATDDRSQTIFVNLIPGTYNVEVAAAGYLTERRDFLVGSGVNVYNLEVTLHPDPTSIDLNAPLASQMSPKVRKATERALTALKSSDYKRAEKALQSAYKEDPSSSDVNSLLGYLYIQRGEPEHALPYLNTAVASDVHNARALTLLGRLHLQQKDYAKAAAILEQAVASDSQSWLAHYLLSQARLQQHEFEKAEHHSRLALAEGKGASKSPLLVLGQALANLGRNPEAV